MYRMQRKIGVVTGLRAEAALLGHSADALRTVSGGGDPQRTQTLIAALIADGVKGLVSFGIAGALDPRLPIGALVLADMVIADGGSRNMPLLHCQTDTAWNKALRARHPGLIRGTILGMSRPASSAVDKALLFARTGALAIDMESHHVAIAAAQSGLPFVALRAISDRADQDLPAAALVGLDKNGKAAIGPVLRSLLSNPRQLPALLRLAGQSRAALAALSGCRALGF